MGIDFDHAVQAHNKAVDSLSEIKAEVTLAATVMVESIKKGGRIYWLGNGGSAADAQHYAAELMVRYTRNRRPIPSIALTTDSSLLTAHSNDFEFESVFERQVDALVTPNDVVVGISTSGNSQNVFLAMRSANSIGAKSIGILGNDGGEIGGIVNYPIIVRNQITAHIQECHLVIGHFLCDFVESEFT